MTMQCLLCLYVHIFRFNLANVNGKTCSVGAVEAAVKRLPRLEFLDFKVRPGDVNWDLDAIRQTGRSIYIPRAEEGGKKVHPRSVL
jgi:hypothetical protein